MSWIITGAEKTPVDPNFSNVSLLLHGDGTNGSTTITDNSPTPKTVTAVGNAQISTAIADPFGNSVKGVLAFDGSGDYAQTSITADFNLNGDFTVEYWVRIANNSGNGVHLILYTSNADKIVLANIAGQGIYYLLNGAITISTSSIAINFWHFVSLCRSGSTTTLYIGGASVGSTSSVPISSSKLLQIGTDQGTSFFNGQIDELRITKGVARYTGNFPPPTAPFPDI
jgi:hypothetical protein